MRGNFQTCDMIEKKIPLRTTIKVEQRAQTEETSRTLQNKLKVVRHPSLKHEIKGAQISHLESQINMFARDQPLFNQTALSKE